MTIPKLPDNLLLTCPLTVEAAEGGDKQMPRFHMVAYTGGPMRIEGFPHPVVVDLEGLSVDRQDIPVRLDHNPRQGVGHTQRVAIENGQVIAEGLISRNTSWARDVAKSGSNGFPWQASIGAAVIDAEFVPNGHTVTVNGRTLSGPLHVVRKAVLKEISFVDSGADGRTSAKVAAQAKEQDVMDEPVPATTDPQTTPTSSTDQPTAASASPDQPAVVNAAEPAPAPATTVHAVAAEPTAPVAPTTVSAAAPPPAAATVANAAADPVTTMRKQMVAEMRRVEAIRRICDGKFPAIEAQAIEQGWDEPTTELQVLRASRPRVAAVTAPQRPSSPQVFEAVALMASGMASRALENMYGAPILEAADRLRGVGIQEFCEMAYGQHLPRFRRDATSWLQAAFSTTSLPGILSNVANKMLLEGYNYVEDAWRQIAKIATVTDFREHSRYRLGGNFRFQQVGPDGELKHGRLDEQRYGQKADTHGIMFALTRQMIINDDLGAFTDIPRQIGMGAAEAIADAVWGLLLSNPVQTDGQAFFSAAHGNYAEGADTALSVDALTAAEVLFNSQTKPNGRPLGMSASLLLVPTALKVPAEMLMKAATLNETTTANKGKPNTNPHTGKYDVVSSVYLSSASFNGSSSRAWYLLADPNRLPAIEVAFLNGVDSPTVEKTDADFTTLGIQFRGYIDFGVREQDWHACVKLKGEA